MAVHAGLRGRNVRDSRNLDRGVTVPAIEAKLADVELVTVRDGLNGTVAHVCVPRGKVVPDARDREGRAEAARDGGHDREFVPPWGEDLGQWLGLRGAGGQSHPTAQTTRVGDPELPRLRVQDGMMRHPRAPKNSSLGTTGRPSIEAGILSTNRDQGQARRAPLSAGTAHRSHRRVTSSDDLRSSVASGMCKGYNPSNLQAFPPSNFAFTPSVTSSPRSVSNISGMLPI
jgi:hypothetical protein